MKRAILCLGTNLGNKQNNLSQDPSAITRSTGPVQQQGKIEIKTAIKMAIPSDYQAKVPPGFNVTFPVEMTPSPDWKQTLDSISQRYNLVFTINDEFKVVYINEGPGGMKDLKLSTQTLIQEPAKQGKTPSFNPNTQQFTLVVEANQKLSEALTDFLSEGNYKLEWNAGSNYTTPQRFVATGRNLKEVLYNALSKFKLRAELWKQNNVVEIVDANVTTQHN
jgi:hypothetical protein